MHVSELKNELMDNYQLRIPSFVWGMPGVGKSDIMRQVCKTLGIAIKDERVTQLNPVDTRGVPSVEDGYTLFNIPNLLPRVDRDGEHGIFFLDELPAARESMQAALYQLILDRKLGDYVLPDGWVAMAAGNEVGHRAVSYRLSTALASRFGHYDLEVNVEEWLEWGRTDGNIHEDMLAYIKFRPEMLHDKEMSSREFRCPRTWAMVNQHHSLMTPQNEYNKVCAFVGKDGAIDFNHFMKVVRLVPTIDEILQDPLGAKLPEELDAIHATTSVVLANVDTKNFKTLMKYIRRIPEEFQALFVNEAIKRDEDLTETESFTKWAQDNQTTFQ
jgi:hypothetical protein